MKIRATHYDADERPAEFEVAMSLDEMAVLYRLSAHIAPRRITELSGDIRWGEALYDLADGAGAILNRYFDEGANEIIPKFRPFDQP